MLQNDLDFLSAQTHDLPFCIVGFEARSCAGIEEKAAPARHRAVIFHQDNTLGHHAHSTLLEINLLGLTLLNHPPYSPDLVPMDFRVYPELKAGQCGYRFQLAVELQ